MNWLALIGFIGFLVFLPCFLIWGYEHFDPCTDPNCNCHKS